MTSDTTPFHIGLLGCGTVGSRVRRAARRARRPRSSGSPAAARVVSGVLTRSRGDVERDPRGRRPHRRGHGRRRPHPRARPRARCAAGTPVVTANKQLLSRHGPELWEAAREGGTELRFEAAVAGVVPVIRVLLGVARRRARGPRPRDRQRHDELHPHADGRAPARRTRRRSRRPRTSATPRPTRPRTSPAATPPRRWRSSPGSRSAPGCTSTTSTYEGIEHLTADDMAYARAVRARPEAARAPPSASAAGSPCACIPRSSTPGTRSRASAARSTPSRSSRPRSPR